MAFEDRLAITLDAHVLELLGIALAERNWLQRGAFVNTKSASGLTPLLQAAAQGALQSMKLLLRAGAEVNEPDNEGWTPLHKAIANDHVQAVELLDEEGADWQARHRSGVTPMALARRKPHMAYLVARAVA